ncbi:MAG TPA: glycosyltransferase family 2 protein [Terriglobia bacterium]|nr:glycosyltransferase family 2 protein [Terriglobia bacterium]
MADRRPPTNVMSSESTTVRYGLIIPALNEAGSIRELLTALPRRRFEQVLVVDNGSTDATAEVSRAAGAVVIREPRRGYGQACWTGLAALRPEISAVAFIDADLSDDPADLEHLLSVLESGGWDLVLGSRLLGKAEPGALTPLQRFGNWLSTLLIRWIWGVKFTDLGPLRVIRRQALDRLRLEDRDFGWTVEMQARAAQLRLKVTEVPVHYRRRHSGQSKISGTLRGSFRAGVKILWTIYRCWRRG